MNDTTERHIAVTDVKRLLSEDRAVVLVDARTPEAFAEEHVPGAVNVPIPDLAEFLQSRENAIKGLIVTMCGSTGRGEKAAAKLASLGVEKIAVLAGGLMAWKAAALPSTFNRALSERQ